MVLRDVPHDLVRSDSGSGRELLPRFDQVSALFRRRLQRGSEDGTIRDPPVDEAAVILLSRLNAPSRHRLMSPRPPGDLPALGARVLSFCRLGLAAGPQAAGGTPQPPGDAR